MSALLRQTALVVVEGLQANKANQGDTDNGWKAGLSGASDEADAMSDGARSQARGFETLRVAKILTKTEFARWEQLGRPNLDAWVAAGRKDFDLWFDEN